MIGSFQLRAPHPPPRYQAKSIRKDAGHLTWFIRVLWKAFPEATSEHELSELVAEFLSKEGQTVTPRTVRYWLRQDTTPHFNSVFPILVLAGAESVMGRLFGTGGRS